MNKLPANFNPPPPDEEARRRPPTPGKPPLPHEIEAQKKWRETRGEIKRAEERQREHHLRCQYRAYAVPAMEQAMSTATSGESFSDVAHAAHLYAVEMCDNEDGFIRVNNALHVEVPTVDGDDG